MKNRMKCLILAAGYATRLYPLTKDFPKPLLKVGDRTILDWLVQDVASEGSVDQYIVVTNHRFAGHFEEWAAGSELPITVVDDGTDTNETRLGAVRDIEFAVEKLSLDDDLLVLAGDNVLDFSLTAFIRYASGKGASCLMRYWEGDPKRLTKSGVCEVDANDRLLSFEEKPAIPKSNWCAPPFYFYVRGDVHRIVEAIADGCATDAPGSLAAWMCRHSAVYAMEMPGSRYDIGNIESYEAVCRTYRGIVR